MTNRRKISLILCAVILTASIAALIWFRATISPSRVGDMLGYPYQNFSINTLLVRRDNWQKIVKEPLFEKPETLLLVDGSTATVPITAELLRQFYGAQDGHLEGKYSELVAHSTTHTAYEKLLAGGTRAHSPMDPEEFENVQWEAPPVRLLFVTPPSAEETALAAEQGVTLDMQPLARDGFVFITHKDNPVNSLTVEQIQQIYSGKIKNWKELGGRDEKIRAFQREPNSGSQTAMEQLVMQGIPMKKAPKTRLIASMGALVDAVAEYENGTPSIGYTYYYYINNLYKSADIKVLQVEGITPEHENLKTKRYPFTADYCVVIRADEPQDSDARRLRDYMLSSEGQRIVEMAGYCPVK